MSFKEELNKFILKLNYFNYSKRTIEIYVHYLNKFLISVNKYSKHLTSNDFQNYLNNYKFTSISYRIKS